MIFPTLWFAGGDKVSPIRLSISVDVTGLILTITYNEVLAGGTTASQLVLTGCIMNPTVTSSSAVGNTIVANLSAPILWEDSAPMVAYTAGADPIEDVAENPAPNFSATAITNGSHAGILGMFGATVGDDTLRGYYPDETASIAAGTDATGLYRIADIPCHAEASVGGTIAQGTAANQPQFCWLKGGNFARKLTCGSAGGLVSSAAASAHKFLSQFASGASIAFVFKKPGIIALHLLLNTKATAGTGTGIGITVGTVNTNEFRISIGDGTANQSVTTSGDPYQQDTNHVVVIRLSQTETNKVEIFVDGVSRGTATSLTITPSASDPGAAFTVINNASNGQEFVSGVTLIEKYVSDDEVAAITAELTAKYTTEYASLAEIVSDAAVQEIDHGWNYNASGPVTLIGAVDQVPVNTPTYATDAGANNKYAGTLAAGSTQYWTINGVAAALSGTDKSYGFMTVAKVNDTAATKTLFALDHSTTAGFKRFRATSAEVMESAVGDDAAATDTNTDGNAIPATYTMLGCSHFGTATSMFLGRLIADDVLAQDVGALTVDLATIGATRPLGVAASPADMSTVCQLLGVKGFNAAKAWTLEPGLRAEYAGAWA